MKKAFTIILISMSAMLILDSMNAGHAIFMFLLAGVIPGTNIVIEASRMLEMFALLIGFTLARSVLYFSKLFIAYQENLTTSSEAIV